MDINESATRPRDREGMPNEALAVATVSEESGTTQAEIGELIVRVFKAVIVTGDEPAWQYDIRWRGQEIWCGVVRKSGNRRHAEFMAGVTAKRLGWALGCVHETGGGVPPASRWKYFGIPKAENWVALPDQPEEPRA